MTKAAIFDIDGTLVDSVDLHATAWQDAFVQFGHDVSSEQARSQIGEGGDQRLPVFLSPAQPRIVATIWKRGAGIQRRVSAHGPPIFGSARIIATCSRRRPEYSSRVVGQKEELAIYLDIANFVSG
jgi:beta-phosphoglucomutase-like phosphatase (HAD superfamily)